MAKRITLFHCPYFRSTRPLWFYFELQTIYPKLEDINLITMDGEKAGLTFRTSKPKELLDINPNGKVPTMRDSKTDVTMFEGCAIVYYFLEQFDTEGKLIRKSDPKFSALLHQVSFYVASTLDNIIATSSPIQRVMTNPRPGDDPETIRMNKNAFKTICGPFLEQQLGPKTFMYGDEFTAIDVILGYSLIAILGKHEDFLDGFDGIKAYAKRLAQRPAFIKAISQRV